MLKSGETLVLQIGVWLTCFFGEMQPTIYME